MARSEWLGGWLLVGWAAHVLLVMFVAILAIEGTGAEGLGIAIRATARTSFALFTAAFVASSLRRLWPTPASGWLLRNRRYLGVSFAISHGLHAVAIVLLASLHPETYQADTLTLVFGGFGFAVLAAMTATSFDRSAACLGPRRWKALHRFGMYYLWTIFFVTTLPIARVSPGYLLYPVVSLAALGLRLATARRSASRAAPAVGAR